MNSKQLKGLPVIDLRDGTKLGTIDEAMFGPTAKQIVGFVVPGAGPQGPAENDLIVATSKVHALGADALTLDDAAAHASWRSAAFGAVEPLGHVVKRKVFSEGGTDVTVVAD